MNARTVGLLCSLFLFAGTARATVYTWSGNDASVSWSVGNNWLGNTAPTSNYTTDLVFTGTKNLGSSGTPLNQNINSQFQFSSITFTATAGHFYLGGNALQGNSAATITQNSNIAQDIDNDISFGAKNGTLTLGGDGTGVVTLSGILSSKGGGSNTLNITKNGSSIFVLKGANTPGDGATTINGGTLVAANTSAFGSGILTVANGATLAVASGITLTKTATWNSGAILAGLGTYTPGGTFSVASGRHVAPGIADGTNNAGTLTIGNNTSFASGSYLDIDLNGALADKLAITGSLTVASGANLTFNTLSAPTAGKYVLLTASSGTFTNNFTFTAPTGYRLAMSSSNKELDLIHKADQAFSNPTATFDIFVSGTHSVGGYLVNTAPVNSDALNISMADNGNGTGGTVSGLPTTGTITASSSAAFSCIFTAGTTAGLNRTWVVKNTDANAVTSPVTLTGTVNVYNHAAGVVSSSTLTMADVIVGYTAQQISDSLYVTNNASAPAVNLKTINNGPLGSITLGNIAGLAASSSLAISSTLATGKGVGAYDEIFTLTYADDSTLNGASSNVGSSVIHVRGTVLNHSSPSLSSYTALVNLLKGAVATESTALQNAGGNYAGLEIVSTGGMTDSGSGLIVAGSSRSLTVAVDTSTMGIYNSQYTIQTRDDQLLPGHNTGNANKIFTVSGVVGWATADRNNILTQFGMALTANVAKDASYNGLASLVASTTGTSGAAALGSEAVLGSAIASGATQVAMAWRTRTQAEADMNKANHHAVMPADAYDLLSDVVSLSGVNPDNVPLTIKYDPGQIVAGHSESYLAGNNPYGVSWIYLAELNSGQWTKVNGSTVNTTDHTVTATVDNGIYAVVPEPGTFLLLTMGGLVALVRRRK